MMARGAFMEKARLEVLTNSVFAGTIPPMSRDTAATRDVRSFGVFFFDGYFGA
jgi:hypothetical protein